MATTQHTTKTNISKSHNLLGYLAAIGLAQELHTIDPTAATHWEESLIVDSTLSTDDIENHLANDYAPAGIIAPWQTANGMWAKESETKQALENVILKAADRRAKKLQLAYSIAEDVLRNHLCSIGDVRPDKDTQDEIQQEIAANYPDHDIGKYAALLLASTRPLPGNKGTNGRYSYSSEHIRAAARLINPDEKSRARDRVNNWAPNIIRHNSNLPLSRVNYSGLLAQHGKALGSINAGTAKIGNPLLLMLAMQGAIATEYATQYSDPRHILAPLWLTPMVYSELTRRILSAPRHVLPALRALSADNADTRAFPTSSHDCAAYRYERGFIGRDQIHARRLGYVSIPAPDKCIDITIPRDGSSYYHITRVSEPPIPPHKDRPNYESLIYDYQVNPAGLDGVPLEAGKMYHLAEKQIVISQRNNAIECYIVRHNGLALVRDWVINKSDEANPMRSYLSGRQLRDVAARHKANYYGIDPYLVNK